MFFTNPKKPFRNVTYMSGANVEKYRKVVTSTQL